MSIQQSLGPNPLAHVIRRQQGSFNYDIRTNLFRERLKVARNLYEKDLISHFGCVNAIEFSREGEYLVSGGDDRRVLLWHVEKSMVDKEGPREMDKRHQSNIFCLGFNSNNSQIFSGGNDDTVIVHDIKTGDAVDVFSHEKPVYGLSIDPLNDNIFASAGEDGRVLIFDLRAGVDEICIAKYRAPFHAVMFHPMDGGFLITANAKEGAGLWDIRRPKTPLIRYSGEGAQQNCMCVRFNTLGTSIVALRRRLPPILYSTFSETPICQFYHPDYYNSCTMKSCCFAGENDEYILSGSDDFNLYVWRINDADLTKTEQWVDSSQMVLYGHRSIVNQVRYNSQKCIIASSGVEKIIKLWTPFELNGWSGSLQEESVSHDNQRSVYSHEEYLSLMNISIQNMTHDYANQNTREDPRMMAFFDSLIQQEIEAWHSSATSDSDQSTQHTSDNTSGPTSRQSSDSSSSESTNDYVSVRECNRNGNNGTSTSELNSKPQRTKYPNRIAYLIATKRNSLKRLAMKGASTSAGRMKSAKYGNRKTKRINLRGIRKIGKRNGRYASKNKTKRHSSREPNSDSEVPTNKKIVQVKRRVTQQHLNTSSYHNHHHHRSYRVRKIKANHNTTNSNNNCNTTNNNSNGNNTCSPNLVTVNNSGHKRKYNTTLLSSSDDSDEDDDDDDDDIVPNKIKINVNNNNSNSLNSIPSTSTGITENSKGMLFRLSQQEIDSDDDHSTINSPVNNNNHNNSNNNNQNGSNNSNNNNIHNNDIYSSHSNSRLSNSSYQEDCSSNDSLNEYFTRRKKLNSNKPITSATVNQNGQIPADEENVEIILNLNNLTPQTKRHMYNQTPDSGIATTACSSTGSSITNHQIDASHYSGGNSSVINIPGCSSSAATTTDNLNNNSNNNNNSVSMKLFNQKVSRVRRNYRNNFGYDTDSD